MWGRCAPPVPSSTAHLQCPPPPPHSARPMCRRRRVQEPLHRDVVYMDRVPVVVRAMSPEAELRERYVPLDSFVVDEALAGPLPHGAARRVFAARHFDSDQTLYGSGIGGEQGMGHSDDDMADDVVLMET